MNFDTRNSFSFAYSAIEYLAAIKPKSSPPEKTHTIRYLVLETHYILGGGGLKIKIDY